MATSPELFGQLDAVAAREVEIRHALHRQPELGYQEKLTSAAVCRELERLGIPYQKGLAGGTGVVAMIEGQKDERQKTKDERGDGPCVALRADMDALPIKEETGLPYASERPGVMHACGHDGHTAILLGAAAILARAEFVGKVKLVFQPAEEGGCGAERMVKDGVLENPKVGAIFGLHGWPGLKVGMAATKPGALLASVDGFTIRVTGRGGHAAVPQDAIDPIVCAAAMVQGLQQVVSREGDPTDACVVTVSQIHAGTAFNVIPDTVMMQGTLRALSRKRRQAAIASIERICRGIAAAHRCEAAFEYFGTTPVTANTPELAGFVRETAQRVLGARAYVDVPKATMWGEDFAFYVDKEWGSGGGGVPGCFYLLGVQPMDREEYPMLHSPAYDFTDAAVPVGIRMMVELALGWLGRGER